MTSTIVSPTRAATLDQDQSVTFYVLLWKREGIKLKTFGDYWRDVHGPVCARLPGQYEYRQLHVRHNSGDPWSVLTGSVLNGVTTTVALDDQIDGIAELVFASEQDRNTWFQAATVLMDDEQNIFSKAIGYNTNPGNSQTYVDRTRTATAEHGFTAPTFHVLVRQAEGVSLPAFRNYMTDVLAPTFSQHPAVMKFRLHLFEAVDNSRPDAAGVAHVEAPAKQYQAAFEITFADLDAVEQLQASRLQELPQYVKDISFFQQHAVYTFVQENKLTLAGQRGASIADLITHIGATNQVDEKVVSLMSAGTVSSLAL